MNFCFKRSTFPLFRFAIPVLFFSSLLHAQSGWVPGSSGANVDLVAVYFTSDRTGWLAGDGGFLASSNDGGSTWAKYALNTSEDINEIYFRNNDNGYLVAGRVMFITHDAGRTWRETK